MKIASRIGPKGKKDDVWGPLMFGKGQGMSGIGTLMSGIGPGNTSDGRNRARRNWPCSGHQPGPIPDIKEGQDRVLEPELQA